MLNVVCYKWGKEYTPLYVNNLYSQFQRHLSLEHNFICFTDDPTGIQEEVDCRPLEPGLGGWWTRFNLFNPNNGIKGRILAVDIDTVITGSLDDIGGYAGEVAFLRDFQYGHSIQESPAVMSKKNGGRLWVGTGLMSFESGWGTWLYKLLREQYSVIDHDFKNCQQYIGVQCYRNNIKPDLFQEMFPGQLWSYRFSRLNIQKNFDAAMKEGLRMMCFHGRPKPSDELQRRVPYIVEHWK